MTDLMHIGTLHKSGRYPWGSGDTPEQRYRSFLGTVNDFHKKGLSDVEISKAMGMTTTELRQRRSIARNEIVKADASQALRLHDTGMSNVAVGLEMNRRESSVRSLLSDATQNRVDLVTSTSSKLKEFVTKKGFLDIGAGVNSHIGVSETQFKVSVRSLQDEGYTIMYLKRPQVGVPGQFTSVKVLAPPGAKYSDLLKVKDTVGSISDYSDDHGENWRKVKPPVSIASKRVSVRYAEDGGGDADGVIYVRRGVEDVSLGKSMYAQVRVAVDGTHYLKGMAMYHDNIPDGVDLVFNTVKSSKDGKLEAMKPMKNDSEFPFGAVVKPQREYTDAKGKTKQSVINVVNEEGDWEKWSHNLSSQMLSKQSPVLAKQQLEMKYLQKKEEYDQISTLTNPAVKKKLLTAYSDGVDSAAVHLKAHHMPRQESFVILPMNQIKETEIYAPKYNDGERVVLIRHPHGGTFEIPELTVNNRQTSVKKLMGGATDAIGINAKVASRLSGADFDGDTVLVIPNNYAKNDPRSIKTSSPLKSLEGFNPQTAYPHYAGMPKVGEKGGGSKQQLMGDISNLITDMTIKGANSAELARAVKHSMVVIDAEKHHLNYKLSAKDNNIAELKKKYQSDPANPKSHGASTLISRASSTIRVPERKARLSSAGGPIDPLTGEKKFQDTGRSYTNKKGVVVNSLVKTTKMAEATNAHSLITGIGTPMETIYADHANRLKALANSARKQAFETRNVQRSPSAAIAYASEVASLTAKLNIAKKNAPLERNAQGFANATIAAKKQATPSLEEADLKKIRASALFEARHRTGAEKQQIMISDTEWTAIQAGAISNARLTAILDNSDLTRVKELATPRTSVVVSESKLLRAKQMASSGYTQAEIANQLGVPTSTLREALVR
jgi:hypothetical protein